MAKGTLDVSEIIGEYIARETETEAATKLEATKPFEFMNAVGTTKRDIIKENPEIASHYNAYIINRGFGYFPDTVLHANALNMYPTIPPVAQYQYYMASLRKSKRFSEWFKIKSNPDLEMVKEIYQVRSEVAKGYMRILSEDDLATLRKLTSKGDEEKTKSKKSK
jgi:hypothetical protein